MSSPAGVVRVLGGAPYGSHSISKPLGGGGARCDRGADQARVVRPVLSWVGQARGSIGAVGRRWPRAGEPRRAGNTRWERRGVWGRVKNPAYKGTAGFGQPRGGARKRPLRAQRGRALHARQPQASEEVPHAEGIFVPVPARLASALSEAGQEQVTAKRRRARQGHRGGHSVLHGLRGCQGWG